ncbi:hypothetical protein [Acinetobacter sp. HY1485]|uniref:hypothetical protein n=1 Tax=Acinetobacter sp. HY1485 TaxID=2970918 RepID=UPI0022B9774F|nr:hypothetical protein [Acinetobacter sp. HY1485]
MTIAKLDEFAKTGQKSITGLTQTEGFPANQKPARQWFNYLFNKITLKINDLIDSKLDINANAQTSSKLEVARLIGGVSFDGSKNIDLPGVNQYGNQSTSGNAATATKLQTGRKVLISGAVSGEGYFDGTDDLKLNLSGSATDLRVVQGSNYKITYDDYRRIAIIELNLWTNDAVSNQTQQETKLSSSKYGIFALPIQLKKRITADVQIVETNTSEIYNKEAMEWLTNVMPDGYQNTNANEKLFVRFKRWTGSDDEKVSAIATVMGIF